MVFENNKTGKPQLVSPEALSAVFEAAENVQCVVMNACYSDLHAEAITLCVDAVVGMKYPITDEAAISFASGLYRGLGEGLSISRALSLGKAQIMLDGGIEQRTPNLRTRKGVDANHLIFT